MSKRGNPANQPENAGHQPILTHTHTHTGARSFGLSNPKLAYPNPPGTAPAPNCGLVDRPWDLRGSCTIVYSFFKSIRKSNCFVLFPCWKYAFYIFKHAVAMCFHVIKYVSLMFCPAPCCLGLGSLAPWLWWIWEFFHGSFLCLSLPIARLSCLLFCVVSPVFPCFEYVFSPYVSTTPAPFRCFSRPPGLGAVHSSGAGAQRGGDAPILPGAVGLLGRGLGRWDWCK